MTQVLMPALSPTMTEGKLARWLKKIGDDVRAAQRRGATEHLFAVGCRPRQFARRPESEVGAIDASLPINHNMKEEEIRGYAPALATSGGVTISAVNPGARLTSAPL